MEDNHECNQTKRIENIELALFGNEELGIKGDHLMITEMHKVLVQGGVFKKMLVWIFSTIMAVGSAVLLFFHLMKEFKK